MENDDALEVVAFWNAKIKLHPKRWTASKIVEFFRIEFFEEDLHFGGLVRNAQMLALGELLRLNRFRIPKPFKTILEKVVAIELSDKVLAEWVSPEQRKKVLLGFLAAMGGQVLETSPEELAEPLEFFDNEDLLRQMDGWLSANEPFSTVYPKFFDVLDRICTDHLGPPGTESYDRDTNRRLLFLTFYVGWWLTRRHAMWMYQLDKEDALKLIELAASKRALKPRQALSIPKASSAASPLTISSEHWPERLKFADTEELLPKLRGWLHSDKQFSAEYPKFFEVLDQACIGQLDSEKDDELYARGTSQRLMLLTCYVGWRLELPKEETLKLAKLASKRILL